MTPPTTRKPLDGLAIGTMLSLCACWGLQQVALKASAEAMHPLLQMGVRSFAAGLLVACWMALRRERIAEKDGTLVPGMVAGLLFAGEFLAVSVGLLFTTASHMAVFLYTAPVFTAVGLHLLVKGEQLTRRQWLGVTLAALGVVFAFSAGFGGIAADRSLLGDLLGILGGVLWACTTLVVRKTSLAEISPAKTLLYQLGTAAVLLTPLALLTGKGSTLQPGPLLWVCLAFQILIVSFASFLLWFGLLRKYLASRLSVFSFLTPVFGVTFGFLLLGEKPHPRFLGGAVLILGGIVLVNLRQKSGEEEEPPAA